MFFRGLFWVGRRGVFRAAPGTRISTKCWYFTWDRGRSVFLNRALLTRSHHYLFDLSAVARLKVREKHQHLQIYKYTKQFLSKTKIAYTQYVWSWSSDNQNKYIHSRSEKYVSLIQPATSAKLLKITKIIVRNSVCFIYIYIQYRTKQIHGAPNQKEAVKPMLI